jgi:hypothetical protein
LTLFDAQGRLVEIILHDAIMEEGSYQIPIHKTTLLPGIYYVHLQSDTGQWIQKVIAIK